MMAVGGGERAGKWNVGVLGWSCEKDWSRWAAGGRVEEQPGWEDSKIGDEFYDVGGGEVVATEAATAAQFPSCDIALRL